MQTIEAGFKLFEWQYDVIAERNAVRSVFSGRSTSYQVFVMRLLEEGLYRFVILCSIEAALEHRAGLGEFLHRTNTSLPLGAFELEVDRGAVRWVSSVETNGDPIPPHWIGGAVQRGLTSFETIWEELLAVAEGRMIPSAAAMRSQVAMELPQVNQQLEAHDTVLSLPAIDASEELSVVVSGDQLDAATALLEPLFGDPLPFALKRS